MSVYKKFSPLDYATVPFNAHKQYDFTSASAIDNQVQVFDTKWTSESLGKYSSGSISGSHDRADVINTIKYNQLDHLYYRNYKRDVNNKFGNSHYLKQRRVLYENANILSIPAGLYGHQIKPGSFFLSSSNRRIVDDKNGNLMIEGTKVSDYVTDPRANILNIGPVKGFKRYDLNVIEGYINDVFYKDGEVRVDTISSYSTPQRGDEFDDSYYFNILEYKDVTFEEKSLFDFDRFPGINFNGSSSEIRIGHDDKLNFNKGDDFTIMFFVGQSGSRAIHTAGSTNYLLAKSTTKTIVPFPSEGTAGIKRIQDTGSSQPIDTFSEPQYPFEIYLEHANNSPHIFFRRSDGDIVTTVSASFNTSSVDKKQLDIVPGGLFSISNSTDNLNGIVNNFITSSIGNNAINYPSSPFTTLNVTHFRKLIDSFPDQTFSIQNLFYIPDYINGGNDSHPNSFANTLNPATQQSGKDVKIDFNLYGMVNEERNPIVTAVKINFDQFSHGCIQISGSNDGFTWTSIAEEENIVNLSEAEIEDLTNQVNESPTTIGTTEGYTFLGPRKIHQFESIRKFEFQNNIPFKWYRLRFVEEGFWTGFGGGGAIQYWKDNGTLLGFDVVNSVHNLNFTVKDVQFFEGGNLPHVTCRVSSSQMQIFLDGQEMGTSGSDNSIRQTQNTANLYIGNKGGKTNHLTGSLSQINIFNRALTNTQVLNHYKSSDGSPYVGNIFYSSGMVAITQPGVEETALATLGIGDMIIGENFIIDPLSVEGKAFTGINQLKFQGSHLIYEHEYQCTLDEYEFNDTLNPSARKIRSHQSQDLADFATGSLFKPYITTVGLYNENNELLVVGKLGQPTRTSDETDTTLIVRWDT